MNLEVQPCLQGQSVVRQSLTDAFKERRVGHLEMPIRPAHLSFRKNPRQRSMMPDDLVGFNMIEHDLTIKNEWFDHVLHGFGMKNAGFKIKHSTSPSNGLGDN